MVNRIPQTGQRYRITTSTVAIMSAEGHSIAVTIPTGGIVEVVDGAIDGDRLTGVRSEGRSVVMFTRDLLERGEELVGETIPGDDKRTRGHRT
ncbi:MAG TPA: hypothetical protein VGZ73_03245 [Bryobacteraceae bacterium]|jgi:hypothetical protein|nr:hypothetical protein [Bryobacteraceae bacterium]